MLVRFLLAGLVVPSALALLSAAPPRAGVHLIVAPAGNEVRYRVREQLAGFDLPNDAIGKTSDVTGGVSLDATGKVISADSKIVVDVTKLASDRDRRDGYVQRRLLETAQYPTVTLAPTAVTGLPWPLPTSGSRTFDLTGDLTVHGVTHPTTWHVTATFNGSDVTGTSATAFTFTDFGLTQPRVPIVLSVADTIHLEYDFHLVPAPAGS